MDGLAIDRGCTGAARHIEPVGCRARLGAELDERVRELTDVEDLVVLTLPASSAYLSVLRTVTAGLAAHLDFTLDEIEDLRIAIDEACAMMVAQAAVEADLTCRFQLEADLIKVDVSVRSDTPRLPARDTFAWTVLSALVGSVDATCEGDIVTIRLAKRKGESA